MTREDRTGKAFDPFGWNPMLSRLGEASVGMMEAWTKAWQTTLTERAVPAMNLMNPALWATGDGRQLAEALEGWLGTPEWSDLLSLDSETLKSFAPAAELVHLGREYHAAVARLSVDICTTFQRRLAETDRDVEGAGEALDIWNDVLDEALMAFNRSETFADLQRRYVRALMAYRLEQRWLSGRIAEQFDLPTRDEIDELARRVHALERENRRLRRALAAQSIPAKAGAQDD